MRSAARLLVVLDLSLMALWARLDAVVGRATGFIPPSCMPSQEPILRRYSTDYVIAIRENHGCQSRLRRSLLPLVPHHWAVSIDVDVDVSSPLSSITVASEGIRVQLPAFLRATASAAATYIGMVAYLDRPRGTLMVNDEQVRVQQSSVPGAGLGLFAAADLPRGTVLGTYPGVVIPLLQHTRKLRQFPACEGYIWRFSDNQMVIDPTNQRGKLEETVLGGNPSQPGSVLLFESILSKLFASQPSPTILCRINEPPRGKDVNVLTREDLGKRAVTFELERDVHSGEELFIDYGLSYDRSPYGGEFIDSTES